MRHFVAEKELFTMQSVILLSITPADLNVVAFIFCMMLNTKF